MNNNNSFGTKLMAAIIVIAILFIIGAIVDLCEPKCIKAGCDRKQSSGSSYCYLHKPISRSSSSSSSKKSSSSSSASNSNNSSSSSSSSTSKSSSSYSGSSNNSTSTKKDTYKSYDDGYDDIYMDGDYDYDRYRTDRDYADGVDDAMDDLDEDW